MKEKRLIDALKKGRRLCGICHGRGKLQYMAYPDFEGDQLFRFFVKCSTCRGSGLESPSLTKKIRASEAAWSAKVLAQNPA